jgi:type IV pilus assembly protein PilC
MSNYEYRLQLKDRTQKSLERRINASSYFDARNKAQKILRQTGGKILSINRKKAYSYTVERSGRTFDGTQSGFTKNEVKQFLSQHGFKVRSVKRSFEIFKSAPASEVVGFIAQSAKLIEQKLPYHEVLQLMLTNVKNKNLQNAIREIISDLRKGSDSQDAFLNQSKVLGYHTALMLGIATKSGDMKSIFESVARLVERQVEFKKGLTSSLMLPLVTTLALIGAIVFYAVYLVPQMMDLLGPMLEEIPPLTAFTLSASDFIKGNIFLILGTLVFFVVVFYIYIATPKGKIRLHQNIVRIPYIGNILRNTSVEIFCRVLGIMYTSSGENIDAIQIASEASGNLFFSNQIKNVAIPSMLKYGMEFGKALELTRFLPEMAVSRFKTGAETGNVKATAIQLADYYQMENGYAMKNLVTIIELSVSVIITLSLVFLTYLSSETASLKIHSTPMQ